MRIYILLIFINISFIFFSQTKAVISNDVYSEFNSGNFSKTDSILSSLISKDSLSHVNDYNKFYLRALSRMELMKFNLALLDLNQVILLFPSFEEAYYERGRCLFILGQYESALTNVKKAIEIRPNYGFYYNLFCTLNYELKTYQEVKNACSKWVKIDKDNPYIYFHLSVANTYLGDDKQSSSAISLLKLVDRNSILIYEAQMFYNFKFKNNQDLCLIREEMLKKDPNYILLIGDDEFLKCFFECDDK